MVRLSDVRVERRVIRLVRVLHTQLLFTLSSSSHSGAHQLETVALLFALKCLYPARVPIGVRVRVTVRVTVRVRVPLPCTGAYWA